MLPQSNDVIFSYDYGLNINTFRCTSVRLGLRLLGSVEDDLDFTMVEDYQAVRQTITIRVRLNFTTAQWMAGFVASEAKRLIIDGTPIEVVNGFDELDFELLNGYNAYADVEMVFFKKDKGLATFTETQVLGYLLDDLVGVI